MKKKFLSVALTIATLLSVLSFSAYAVDVTKTTRTETLVIAFSAESMSNEAEGWSWNAETGTLTLDNVNFETDGEPCIEIKKTFYLNLKGNNTLTAKNLENGVAAVSAGDYDTIVISGDSLTVNADSGKAIDLYQLQTTATNLAFVGNVECDSFLIKGGTVTVTADKTESGICIDAKNWVDVRNGHLILNPGDAPGVKVGVVGNVSFVGTEGFHVMNDASLTVNGGYCVSDMGSLGRADTVIDTKGAITINGTEKGFVQNIGRIDYLSGRLSTDLDRNSLFVLNGGFNNFIKIGSADYTPVQIALTKVPADLSEYRENSVKKLQEAVDAVDYNLDVFDQDKVDAYAQAIEDAVEDLKPISIFTKIFRAIIRFFTNLFVL